MNPETGASLKRLKERVSKLEDLLNKLADYADEFPPAIAQILEEYLWS